MVDKYQVVTQVDGNSFSPEPEVRDTEDLTSQQILRRDGPERNTA